MPEPPFLPAPRPSRALAALLGSAPARVVLFGPEGLARDLGRAGHQVLRWRTLGGEAGPGPAGDPGGARNGAGEDLVSSLDRPPADLHAYDALVLVGALTGLSEPAPVLGRLVGALRPGALVAVLEPAASGPGGRWLGRLLGRWRGRAWLSEASSLAALGLAVGLRDLQQSWPQGLRSLVLTSGRVGPAHGRGP